MYGFLIGDIIGSAYEFGRYKKGDPYFVSGGETPTYMTDDSIMYIATIYAIQNELNYSKCQAFFGNLFPDKGYGDNFLSYLGLYDFSNGYDFSKINNIELQKGYKGMGNGALPRALPIGLYFKDKNKIKKEVKKATERTHGHGITVRFATIAAFFTSYLKEYGKEKAFNLIEKELLGIKVEKDYQKLLQKTKYTELIVPTLETCLSVFACSNSFDDCIEKTLLLDSDSDSVLSVVSLWAEIEYGLPDKYLKKSKKYIENDKLNIFNVIDRMYSELKQ